MLSQLLLKCRLNIPDANTSALNIAGNKEDNRLPKNFNRASIWRYIIHCQVYFQG